MVHYGAPFCDTGTGSIWFVVTETVYYTGTVERESGRTRFEIRGRQVRHGLRLPRRDVLLSSDLTHISLINPFSELGRQSKV